MSPSCSTLQVGGMTVLHRLVHMSRVLVGPVCRDRTVTVSQACSWLVPPQVEASSGSNIFGNLCEDNSVVNSSHRPCHDASLRVLCSNRCITLIPSLIYMRHYGEPTVPQVDPPTTAPIRQVAYSATKWDLVRSVDYMTHPNRVCHWWLGNW